MPTETKGGLCIWAGLRIFLSEETDSYFFSEVFYVKDDVFVESEPREIGGTRPSLGIGFVHSYQVKNQDDTRVVCSFSRLNRGLKTVPKKSFEDYMAKINCQDYAFAEADLSSENVLRGYKLKLHGAATGLFTYFS